MTRAWLAAALTVLGPLSLFAPPSPAAQAGTGDSGTLSSRLAELARPSLRVAPAGEQAAKLSVAVDGPASLLRRGNRVVAEVRFERGAAAGADGLRAEGAQVIHVSRRHQTVTVAVRPADLRGVARAPRVVGVTEVLEPIVSASDCAGLATSEGDGQLGAAAARAAFNLDGTGVTVGILSDSFDRDGGAPTDAAADVGSGDLPGPGNPCGRGASVNLLDDSHGGSDASDEGRAMAQIAHDLAPGAFLAFATAFNGPTAFADNIRALRANGADVIVDDVSYLEEPFFQDGPIAVAVNDVTASGAAYFSSAGNNNLIDEAGNEIASWEAPSFRDTACPAALNPVAAENCMDFDPGAGTDPTFEITVAKGASLTVDLQWAQPWNGVTADLDAFLLDSSDKPIEVGESLLGSAEDNVGVSQRPVEIFQWENDTGASAAVRLAINRCFGLACNPTADPSATPRLKVALLQNGGGVTATEYPKSSAGDTVGPTIFGHNGAAAAVSVAAVPFDNSSTVEPYSSRGPVTHYFGAVTGSAAAAPLGSPRVIAKPDLAATDCGLTTFFVPSDTPGKFRFCGTSAAAPHAAAVTALMRQANPHLSFVQLRTALAVTARPVGAFPPAAAGAGLIDAHGAIASIALPPAVSIDERPPPLGRDRWPKIAFSASRPASFACSLDGGPPLPCASPWFPSSRLRDGTHGFAVRATDIAGRTGQSQTVIFKVDRTRPRVFLPKRPRKLVRTRYRRAKIVFRLRSNERGARFVCKVDGNLWRFCRRRIGRRMGAGKHVLRVKARDTAGNVTRRPATYRFRVKRLR